MHKAHETDNTAALANLLERIGKGEDPSLLRKEATKLLSSLCPNDIALAEKNLIEHGWPAQLVHQLSSAFMLMGIVEEHGASLKTTLKHTHILRLVIAEHDMLRCFIADLEQTARNIYESGNLTDTCTDFRKLCHITEHLEAMQEHIEREEDIIFPYLCRHGWASLCRAAQNDHRYITIAIGDMIGLITSFDKNKTRQFKVKLNSIVKYLCPILREHIFQEDNILYPIAIKVIDDKTVWDKMKILCDEIGYCGIHM